MLSIPPATTTSLMPIAMLCAASITALVPDAHTLLMVVLGMSNKPAYLAACVAGAWPKLAESTLPIYISCTCSLAIPARFTASLIAIAPN